MEKIKWHAIHTLFILVLRTSRQTAALWRPRLFIQVKSWWKKTTQPLAHNFPAPKSFLRNKKITHHWLYFDLKTERFIHTWYNHKKISRIIWNIINIWLIISMLISSILSVIIKLTIPKRRFLTLLISSILIKLLVRFNFYQCLR